MWSRILAGTELAETVGDEIAVPLTDVEGVEVDLCSSLLTDEACVGLIVCIILLHPTQRNEMGVEGYAKAVENKVLNTKDSS